MSEEKPTVDVNVVQVVASALAAVSSAVLLSTVGVAGTVIGAAVGSVIATVGSAVYSYSLRVSRERVAAAAQVAAMARVRRPGREPSRTQHLPAQEQDTAEAEDARPQWRDALAGLNWKRVALITGAVFVAAMVVILLFELIAGESVSNLTGGTSKTEHHSNSLGLGGGSDKPTRTPSEDSTPSRTASATPSGDASSPTSSASSSPTSSPTDVEGTPTPTATPSESATGGSSPTGSASGSPSPGR